MAGVRERALVAVAAGWEELCDTEIALWGGRQEVVFRVLHRE